MAPVDISLSKKVSTILPCGVRHHKTRVYDNILQTIGNTPLVRLNRIPKDHGLQCEIYAKCEYLNPGGSIKDRIAHTMIEHAERTGQAKPGTRFVEPTSGNTGIGIALVAAVKGYHCTITTTDKNSEDKMNTLNALGAEVIQTPSSEHWDSPNSYMSVTNRIVNEDSNAFSLDQFNNEINPKSHYDHTAEEILAAIPHIDMVVMGSGTGGTVSGIGRKMKERCPQCIVVAVDPKGSIVFDNGNANEYLVEGIGGDFVPKVLDKTVIDMVEKADDYASFNMAREIIKKEGLLCGGSSGAAMISAVRAAKKLNLGAGKRVVVILPDGIRNYMTKFVTDQWMEANLFKEPPEREQTWWNRCISNLPLNRAVPRVLESASCLDALAAMGTTNDVALIINEDGFFKGVLTKNSLRSEATNPKKSSTSKLDLTELVNLHVMKTYYKIIENRGNPTVGLASRILDIAPFVVIVEAIYDNKQKDQLKGYVPKGIVTPEQVLEYIIEEENTSPKSGPL